MEYINGIFETFLHKNEEEILKEIKDMSEMDKDKLILKSIGEVKQLRAVNDKYLNEQESSEMISKSHPDDVTVIKHTAEIGKKNENLKVGTIYKVTVKDACAAGKGLPNPFIARYEYETVKDTTPGAFKFSGYDVNKAPYGDQQKIKDEYSGKDIIWIPKSTVEKFQLPTSEEISAAEQ